MDLGAQDDKHIVFMQDGKPVSIDPLGSLGLLATGYRGLLAWRKARQQLDANRA